MKVFKQKQTTAMVPLPLRKHKGLMFRPIKMASNKRDLRKFLRHSEEGIALAHNKYYRIYEHRYQKIARYVLYVSNKNKFRYGGIRKRSKLGMGNLSKEEYRKLVLPPEKGEAGKKKQDRNRYAKDLLKYKYYRRT